MAKQKNKSIQAIDPAEPLTYFQQRMLNLGITDTSAHFYMVEPDQVEGRPYKQPIFTEDKDGNIEIHYPSLYNNGSEIFLQDGVETEYIRKRYKPENEPRDGEGNPIRYQQAPKSGVHIFLPPVIIQKFTKREKIETLFVVEGEFKAWAGAYLAHLDIVGVGGKDLFCDENGLHADIKAICNKCDVENLVLLLDADCYEMGAWDPDTEPHKDLSKRLNSFCNTVLRFREVGKAVARDVYFANVNRKYLDEAKGLDDLLILTDLPSARPNIADDLLKLTRSRNFFECINLLKESISAIKSRFYQNIFRGVPSGFYTAFESRIDDLEFTFKGARYQFGREGLHLVKHEDSFRFIRVGCDYIKIINVPNSKGILEQKRTVWKVGEITRDYVNKGFKDFFDHIEKFDAFCNVPENDPERYQQVISGCYNMYYKLEHVPEAGSWRTIEKYLKHVYGEAELQSGFTNYELALDWLTLVYNRPTQLLPIPCLVSKEKATGKSTFLWFLREMFGENATVIGNDEIRDNYNDDYITKLIIGIDEGFIDKKVIIEKIKSQSTNSKAKLHGKFQSRQDVGFVGKFVLTSNNESNFIAIDDDETRFWVNKVPKFSAEDNDPDLLEKMVEEIPAFLHFLKDREVLHPKKSRHWFDPQLLETEAGRKVKESSKSWLLLELREALRSRFEKYQWDVLFYTFDEVSQMLNRPDASIKFRNSQLRDELEERLNMKTHMKRFKFPIDPTAPMRSDSCHTEEKRARCYGFAIEDYMTDAEILDLMTAEDSKMPIQDIEQMKANRAKRLQLE